MPAIFSIRERFGGKFRILNLEFGLNPPLQRGFKGGYLFGIGISCQSQKKAVSPILYIRDYPLNFPRKIIAILLVIRIHSPPRPPALLHVEPEAPFLFSFPPGPSEVDPPDLGRIPIADLRKAIRSCRELGRPEERPAVPFGKPKPGFQLVTETKPLLLIAVYPLPSPGQARGRTTRGGNTSLTHI
jgi:hypothetical protein